MISHSLLERDKTRDPRCEGRRSMLIPVPFMSLYQLPEPPLQENPSRNQLGTYTICCPQANTSRPCLFCFASWIHNRGCQGEKFLCNQKIYSQTRDTI